MNVPALYAWSRQDTISRAVVISLIVVALLLLAQVLVGVNGRSLAWDITPDPASGFLPF